MKKDEFKTKTFDAILYAPSKTLDKLEKKVRIKLQNQDSYLYGNIAPLSRNENPFVRVHLSKKVSVGFKNGFKANEFSGIVLNSHPEISEGKRKKGYTSLLSKLISCTESEALTALAEFKNLEGLKKNEIICFMKKEEDEIEHLILELERKGKIKIISFSPLFVVSPQAIETLKSKILAKIENIKNLNPLDFEMDMEAIIKKIGLKIEPRLSIYTLKKLAKEKKISLSEGKVILPPPAIENLSKEESEALKELLDILRNVSIYKLSTHEIEKKIGLPTKIVYRLLYLLTVNKKIVRVKTDFFISSLWIEELKEKLKELRGQKLSIADFRKLTGFSRQYLIPLLEFLDEKGITKRIGNLREILI
ncbi:MAG: SelB domain-containing protein [Candidatus Aminicenantia bacterium]